MRFINYYLGHYIKPVGETTINNEHKHEYAIDNVGNGATLETNGHNHKIINFKTVPALDTHMHGLEYREEL